MRIESLLAVGAVGMLSLATNASTASADSREPDAEVLFAFDSSALDDASQTELATLAEHALDTSSTRLIIDTHADPRGTGPYNVALTCRRAVAVRDFLTAKGVDADRIVFAAYGEDGPRRASFAADRRATVTLTAEPMWAIIDASFPGATTVVWNEPLTVAEITPPADATARTARR